MSQHDRVRYTIDVIVRYIQSTLSIIGQTSFLLSCNNSRSGNSFGVVYIREHVNWPGVAAELMHRDSTFQDITFMIKDVN